MPDYKSEDFVEQVAGEFEKRGLSLSNELFDEVLKQVLKLTTKDGRIDSDGKSNRQVIAQMQILLEEYFASSFYSSFAPDIVTELGQIQRSSEFLQKKENDILFSAAFNTAEINPIKKVIAQNVLDSFGKASFNTSAATDLMNVILTSVQSGSTLTQTTAALKTCNRCFR